MYYVILNHTTERAEVMTNGLGTPATFKDKKWAILSGEDALGGNVYEYIVVKSIED